MSNNSYRTQYCFKKNCKTYCCPNELMLNINDNYDSENTDCSQRIVVHNQPCPISPKWNSNCNGQSCYIYEPVDSEMGINDSHINTLRINLKSSIFNQEFDSKNISQITLVRNYNGSVDFVIKFNGINPIINQYPPNPIYKN